MYTPISSRFQSVSATPFPRQSSVAESIAELDVNLPWVVPVEPTEGLAVVEILPAVSHIQGIQ